MNCETDRLFPLGSLVTVKRGKYAGSVCVIVGIDKKDGRILIADGNNISSHRPKRKSLRHIEKVSDISTEVAERLAKGKTLDDGWLCGILNVKRGKRKD